VEKKDSFNPFSSGFVPGLDFMQSWFKGAGNAIPGVGQWVTPTLDPEELKKRIQELKTIQFWLEQNSRMVATTIQALEVQCMTLSTLQTMNIKMADLQASLKIKPESDGLASAKTQNPADKKPAEDQPPKSNAATPDQPAAALPVDPLKWWGSLTEQFTQIATQALKEPVAAASAVQKAAADVVAKVVPVAKAAAAPAAKSAQPAAAKKTAATETASSASAKTPHRKTAAAPRKPRT
jgi:hypothetical protein